ncbi:hypothetical protein ACJRO7_031541 [Eucalyptus globulus]|uniref:Glycosyltransferase n=1 Tax=Eucalyptus globulus TaxID=34317 RepID=A0ABD3JF20_EUCGL
MAKLKHVLCIPFPAQGHVTPLLKLSHCVANAIKVTVVNTESVHAQVMAANQPDDGSNRINFVAFPDGLETDEERKDWAKLLESILRVMPGHLQKFIEKVKRQSKGNEDEHISFVTLPKGWVLKRAGFWAASVSALALTLHIPKLIEGGVIDNEGIALKNDVIPISKDLPSYKSDDLTWSFPEDLAVQKVFFKWMLAIIHNSTHSTSYLCNSFHELEALACKITPGVLPRGSLWNEDSTCSNWLDQHPPQSVIYVLKKSFQNILKMTKRFYESTFGSTTIFSPEQFYELAHSLEQIGQPFLWFHGTFLQRVKNHGKVVQWAPKEEVLAHPSVACFFTHCGWNSTLEGLSNGVPLICGPYFADQRLNRSFICDVWRVGLGVDGDENGVITRHEVRTKILAVLGSDEIKTNCQRMKEMARKSVSEGGSSLKNLESFIDLIKA